MTENAEKSGPDWRRIVKWAVGLPVCLLAGMVALGAIVGPPDPRGGSAAADACDLLVQASGKYPASFRRVSEKSTQFERDKMAATVQYKGRNVFGDEVHSTATCFFDNWLPGVQPRLSGLAFDDSYAHPDVLDALNRRIARGL